MGVEIRRQELVGEHGTNIDMKTVNPNWHAIVYADDGQDGLLKMELEFDGSLRFSIDYPNDEGEDTASVSFSDIATAFRMLLQASGAGVAFREPLTEDEREKAAALVLEVTDKLDGDPLATLLQAGMMDLIDRASRPLSTLVADA